MSTTIKRQLLIKASELLANEENWLKGKLFNHEMTAFCVNGALLLAANQMGLVKGLFAAHILRDNPATMGAADHLRALAGKKGFSNHITLNNDPKTTFEDVKALLREALVEA